jgi:hypothetical protein
MMPAGGDARSRGRNLGGGFPGSSTPGLIVSGITLVPGAREAAGLQSRAFEYSVFKMLQSICPPLVPQ